MEECSDARKKREREDDGVCNESIRESGHPLLSEQERERTRAG